MINDIEKSEDKYLKNAFSLVFEKESTKESAMRE